MGNIWEWNVIPPFLLWCKSPGLWLEENDINPVSALSTSHVLLGGLNLSQKKWLWEQKKLKKMVLSENSVPPKFIVCSICSMKIRWSQMTNWGYPHFQTTLISKTPSSVWKSSDCLHLSASNRSRLSSPMLFHVVEVS
jgi:hypothetical protein